MSWNRDISEAPRGETVTEHRATPKGEFDVEVFKPASVILATKCGKVIKSRWLPPDASAHRERGRWEMLNADEQPVAWHPWPEHPGTEWPGEADDGQPDEMTEWRDYDPDC